MINKFPLICLAIILFSSVFVTGLKLGDEFSQCLAEKISADCKNELAVNIEKRYLNSSDMDNLGISVGESLNVESYKKILNRIVEKNIPKGSVMFFDKDNYFMACGDKKLQWNNGLLWGGVYVSDFCPKAKNSIKNYYREF